MDIDPWSDQALAGRHQPPRRCGARRGPALRAVIAGQGLKTLLQPIVSLPSGQVAGYEALSHGPKRSALETANALFGSGERFSLTVALELACARQATAVAATLPEGRWLSINLGLAASSTPGEVEALARHGIVLDITEHRPLDQAETYAAFFAKVRTLGAHLALDDTGCGFTDMEAARAIRPDIAKLCISDRIVRPSAAATEMRPAKRSSLGCGPTLSAAASSAPAEHLRHATNHHIIRNNKRNKIHHPHGARELPNDAMRFAYPGGVGTRSGPLSTKRYDNTNCSFLFRRHFYDTSNASLLE